ncbi:MAG: beta-lactamase family protein [Desulfobacterales bacterium]|nr:beta-lactamase family protein [Desulfobacterales bacterium]
MMIKKKYFNQKKLNILMVLFVLMLISYPLSVEVQASVSDVTPAVDHVSSNKLEVVLDEYLPEKMEAAHVPGVVVVVVKQGKILLSKGYGYADLNNKTPMTSQKAVRAGSVSKPVLGTVVLQLVEQGLIKLNAPVSEYIADLDFKDDFGPASTIAQLLNHQSGYPDTIVKSHAPTIEGWEPLSKVLAADIPQRTMTPGTVLSYSSWDYALLGYVIEKVTGLPYEEAAAKYLFRPLDMQDTTFLQPLPTKINDNLAISYGYLDGKYQVVPHDFVRMSPGVALVTNGQDMSKYMIAMLNGGILGGKRILKKKTIPLIFERQASVHAFSRGRSYILAEKNFAGRKAFYHDGNGIGFYNRLIFMPQHEVGIFLSINHRLFDRSMMLTRAARMMRSLSVEIVKNLSPESEVKIPDITPLSDAKRRIERYTGNYHIAHVSSRDFFQIEALMNKVSVKDNGDGTLKIGSNNYVEVEPLVFQSKKTPSFFAVFVENKQGEVDYLSFGGTGTYKKSNLFDGMNFTILLIGMITVTFLSMLVIWPIKRQGHWMVFAVSLLNLVYIVGIVLLALGILADLLILFKMIPLQVQILFSVPWISGIMTLGLIVFLIKLWKKESAPMWGKVHYASVIVTSFALFWFANYWNFIL